MPNAAPSGAAFLRRMTILAGVHRKSFSARLSNKLDMKRKQEVRSYAFICVSIAALRRVSVAAIGAGQLLEHAAAEAGADPRPLKAEEEREAVDAWVEHGDIEARNKLVEHNLRLVAHIIKKD